jgi:hypothetical protein
MKFDLHTEGKVPDYVWKIVLVILALGCGIKSDSILLMMGV